MENDRENNPIIFDSYGMSPVLYGMRTVSAQRRGSVRVDSYKAVFNLRSSRAHTGNCRKP
jgi:hypothetical protein